MLVSCVQTQWVASPDGRWAAQVSMAGNVEVFSFCGMLDGMHGAEPDGR